jgi:gamma-glutamyltranspeptidase/glutathione hydrolase
MHSTGYLCLLVTVGSVLAQTRPSESRVATRSEIIAQHGVACTSQPLATQVALDILKAGGSAVDAAIAANAAIGLMEPPSNGIGGDLFAIVWDGQRLHGLNASGRSPYSLALAEFQKRGLKHIPPLGPLPVTVPGCVDGWFELHRRFGRLPMKKLLAPAIRYARDGFSVSPVIARDWAGNAKRLEDYPGFREVYMPDGHAPRPGEVFRNPALARTLERIARRGRDGFYRGETAQAIADYMRRNGGFLSEKDLADHRSEWVEPVSTSYRGYEVWELPPNGQGIATLQMLNLLEGFDLTSLGFGSAAYMHLFTEAKKLAFEDRARYYADPAFYPTPVATLISKDYAAGRRKLLDPDHAALRYDPGLPQLKTGDTIYMTVADGRGMMVSLIQSNYRGMGSGMTPTGLGFVLQDRGELFDLEPGRPNSYAPHKRPFHTIIPAFVTKAGQPFMSFGVMGGDMQPQGHVQVLVNLIDFGMSLQEAGDAPRMYHSGSSEPTGERMTNGGTLNLEPGFPDASVRELAAKGHRIGKASSGVFGGYQAILWDRTNRVYVAASESRKDGQAAGY